MKLCLTYSVSGQQKNAQRQNNAQNNDYGNVGQRYVRAEIPNVNEDASDDHQQADHCAQDLCDVDTNSVHKFSLPSARRAQRDLVTPCRRQLYTSFYNLTRLRTHI
ncbi:hypothetical protein RCIA4 [Methanocella arvoryzae MRE50]|uniref:Uncharacterized protein n=1 Tax=Methanocella arvoryzae (strain DSM 22066 / NBRC 105507 / MRE50) TaxID=351160 RepID=Q0W7P4_METAR|nr:hypothetical protein RCIA4 [Methanocella arvoryzae MRE50]